MEIRRLRIKRNFNIYLFKILKLACKKVNYFVNLIPYNLKFSNLKNKNKMGHCCAKEELHSEDGYDDSPHNPHRR